MLVIKCLIPKNHSSYTSRFHSWEYYNLICSLLERSSSLNSVSFCSSLLFNKIQPERFLFNLISAWVAGGRGVERIVFFWRDEPLFGEIYQFSNNFQKFILVLRGRKLMKRLNEWKFHGEKVYQQMLLTFSQVRGFE